MLHGDVALHVLDDHNGVVDHQPGGQRDSEQRERVDGEAKDLDKGEGANERNRYGDRGDDGGSPIQQKQENNGNDDEDRHAQGPQHLADGVADYRGRIEGDGVLQARREVFRKLGQLGLGQPVHVECVRVRELLDADAQRFVAGVLQSAAVVLGAHLRMAHVLEQHQPVGGVLDDDIVKLLRTGEPAHDLHRDFKSLLGVGRRLAELACGNLHVLLGQRIHHVSGRQPASGQPHRVQPHAHGVFALAEDDHIAHARHALQGVLYVNIEVVGDKLRRVAVVERIKSGAEDEVVAGLGDADAARVDRRRQPSRNAGNAVLDIDGGDVQVVAGLEGDGDVAVAAVGARRADVAHPLDAVDGLFERNGDGLFDGLGVGAGVAAAYRNLWRSQRRVHGHRKVGNADRAGQNDQQCANRRKNRPMNKEINKQKLPSFRKFRVPRVLFAAAAC